MHSATKYLAGHSDLILGSIVTSNDEIAEKLAFIQNASGGVPGPMDCFLTLRGIKLSMLECKDIAKIVEKLLNFYRNIKKLTRFIGQALKAAGSLVLQKQMKDFGGMLSFIPKGANYQTAEKIIKK